MTVNSREALALVNGTSFLSSYAALAVARANRLLVRAEQLTGWMFRLLGASLEPLDARLHAAKAHPGQHASAAAILSAANTGTRSVDPRPLQEPYSLRTAPQVLGACRDQLMYVSQVVQREMNSHNDNPFVDGQSPDILHGGNFQGQHVAFASDALNALLTQAANLAERQLDLLLTPARNGGAPPLLAWEPGRTSGLAGLQLTATAIVAEMRHAATPNAMGTLPTNGGNQDIVSLGALAARVAYGQTERLAAVHSALALALTQLNHLRAAGRAPGTAVGLPPWMPRVQPVRQDRPLGRELARLASAALTP